MMVLGSINILWECFQPFIMSSLILKKYFFVFIAIELYGMIDYKLMCTHSAFHPTVENRVKETSVTWDFKTQTSPREMRMKRADKENV